MAFWGRNTGVVGRETSRYAEVSARWIIGVYSVLSLVTAFSWIISPLRKDHRTSWWEVLTSALNIPASHTLASVVVMVVTTSALITRKRAALITVIVFQVIGFLIGAQSVFILFFVRELIPGEYIFYTFIDAVSLLVCLVAVPFLVSIRSAFPARIGRISWALALLVLVGGFTLTTLVGWYFGRYLPGVSAIALLENGLGLESIPELKGHTPGAVLAAVTSVFYGIFTAGAVYLVLRGYRVPNTWTADSELRLRSLLQQHGGNDSLSYFATRRDKQTVFSADGRAAITYRLVGSVCLASSDPVGDPACWGAAIDAWMRQVRTYGWIPAALSVSEEGARAFARAGLSITRMGDEAVLVADRFSLDNTSLTQVRRTYQRVLKAGYTVRVRRHRDLSGAELVQVHDLADAWRHGKVERGFSMALNRLGDPADGCCLLVSAHGPDGKIVGLLSFVPWGRTGVSLDLMRRCPDAPNGMVEFMVASLMERAGEYGISRVSLNFAMFRHVFDNAQRFGASPWDRFASRSLGYLDRFLQLERLYRFNLKFAPQWVSRYMAFEPTLAMMNTLFAAGVAEGFLPDVSISSRRSKQAVRQLSEADCERVRELERLGTADATAVKVRRSDQSGQRIRHARLLEDAGMSPYPLGLRCDYSVQQVAGFLYEAEGSDGANSSGHASGSARTAGSAGGAPAGEFTVSGRVRFIRRHGGVIFLTLIDEGGTVQAVIERAAVGADSLRLLGAAVDTGDIVLLTGRIGRSLNGTVSVLVSSWRMAAKCLHPIPFDSFTDPEARLRRRSTDLLVHPQQVRHLRMRSNIIRSIRRTLDEDGFTEVETPILNTVHGGASARPFKTFINAYGADLTLRIAPELYLKRLVVGGMGAVYELGRDFRNEGADATHNPEFTVLEAYKPYADYTDMRVLARRLIQGTAQAVFGAQVLPLGARDSAERTMRDVSGTWPVVPVCRALSERLGAEVSLDTDFEALLGFAREHGIHVRDDMGAGAVIEELYGELVEATTVFPTFYTDFPVETSPLAGPHRSVPGLVERWDLVINGMEMGTAYSELSDALIQRDRLVAQSLKAAAGDPEAMQVDEDFLYALETGLPPTGGLGIGIDRLVMLMAQTQIRGVLSFPFVRPLKEGARHR